MCAPSHGKAINYIYIYIYHKVLNDLLHVPILQSKEYVGKMFPVRFSSFSLDTKNMGKSKNTPSVYLMDYTHRRS